MRWLAYNSMHWTWKLSLICALSWAPLAFLETELDGPEILGYAGPLLMWFALRWLKYSAGRTD